MVDIRGFKGIRPKNDLAGRISDLPYDVVNTEEARNIVQKENLSFLKIDRAEVNFPNIEFNNPKVYLKAKELIEEYLDKDLFKVDNKEDIYVYELTFEGRVQYGLVCLSSVEDYLNENIKIHEYTLPEKEIDRTTHIDITGYHTGPIFLLYRKKKKIADIIEKTVREVKPRFDFTTDKGVRHRGYIVENPEDIIEAFKEVDNTYIADGHHRCKSAVNVYLKRKQENRLTEGSKYFLSVIFPTDEVRILPYNRHVLDLGELTETEFIEKIKKNFVVQEIEDEQKPTKKYEITMYMGNKFYKLNIKEGLIEDNILDRLDVSVIQKYIFDEILHIKDPRNDKRLDFIGGINGVDYLVDKVNKKGGAAFIMYPTTVEELLEVADDKKVMPPKSTWFEPKLNSGLFIHKL